MVLGKCPDEIRKFMQVGLDALNMTFDSMRAGVPAADVAKNYPACADLKVQRVSALLSQLGKANVLTVTEDKRKHFYSIAE